MKSKMNKIIPKNDGRFGVIKNLGISLKLPGFPTRVIRGNAGDFAYKTSRDYREHEIEIEHWKAGVLAESQRLQSNR